MLQRKAKQTLYSYVFCIGNIQVDGKTTYFPLYMIQFLKQTSLPENLIVNVDLP